MPMTDGAPKRLTFTGQGEIHPYTPDGPAVIFQSWNEPKRVWRMRSHGRTRRSPVARIGAAAWTRAERYRAGDKAGAVDAFLQGVAGLAIPECSTRCFLVHSTAPLPRRRRLVLRPGAASGRRIAIQPRRRPTCHAAAAGRARRKQLGGFRCFARRQSLLLDWLLSAEPFVLSRANHLLHVQNPRGMARPWPPSSLAIHSRRPEVIRTCRHVGCLSGPRGTRRLPI